MAGLTFRLLFRSAKKQFSYTLINLLGLTTGITCCILILLFIRYELSFDRRLPNADRLYRITCKVDNPNGYTPHFARCFVRWTPSIADEIPEIEQIVRFVQDPRIIHANGLKYNEPRIFLADKNALEVFKFPLVSGDPATAFSKPGTVLITEEMAKKYFGDADPIGKTIETLTRFSDKKSVFQVSGVLENFPPTTHFHIDFLIYADLPKDARGWFYTYALLAPGKTPADFSGKMDAVIDKYIDEYNKEYFTMPFQKVTGIHLHSHIDRELEPNGDIKYVYIFTAVALLILLIACINFVNLSTARAAGRTKEIGIRKVIGARKAQLAGRFLGESLFFSLIATLFSLTLVFLLLPYFNALSGRQIHFDLFEDWIISAGIVLIMLVTGFASGSYPALYLSSFIPVHVLKPSYTPGGSLHFLRKGMVIFQFTVSIILIITTLIIGTQMDYMMDRRLKTGNNQILVFRRVPEPAKAKYRVFKQRVSSLPGVKGVTAVMDEPSKEVLDAGGFIAEGITQDPQNQKIIYILPVDDNFTDFFGLKMAAGDPFTQKAPGDTTVSYIINESAVKFIGWDSPEEAVGKSFKWRELPMGRIIGIIKDFKYSTMHTPVKPFVYFIRDQWLFCQLINIGTDHIPATIASVGTVWKEMFPDYPFTFTFIDKLYETRYRAEIQQGKVLGTFSILTVFIACLGLFGLASYTAQQKTKEIGIRKVLGASVHSIVVLLTGRFLIPVAIANLIAWPAAFYFMRSWLENFAYKADIPIGIFFIAGALSIVIAFLTILFQSVKAGLADPVKTLRYE